MERQKRIREGQDKIDIAFSGFDPSFYDDRRKSFLEYGQPQLETSFKQAQRSILNNLARRGLLQSSAGARAIGALTRERSVAEGNLAGRADDYVNQIRNDVASQKLNLSGLLQSSADPAAASTLAQTSAAGLANRPAFAPLGEAFANLTALAAENANSVALGNPSIFRRPSSGGGGIGSRLKITS